ncbi:chemotaxis protein CheW [Phormidesmis sp. 146-12]
MLMLLFQAGENLYAIDSAQVIEVIAIVTLRKLDRVPSHVAGVFNYRGSIVPVIDLSSLIVDTPCRSRYSTRIMMVKDQRDRLLGLLAERVTETLSQADTELSPIEPLHHAPYLGEILINGNRMIQRFHWETLISEVQRTFLIAGENAQANVTNQH